MHYHDASRLAAVLADLRDRGYHCPEPADDELSAVATDGDHPIDGSDDPLSVERARDVTPLSLVSHIGAAADAGRVPVLVVDKWDLADVREILGEPFLLRGRSDGRRQFYSIPDRIALTDGRYACVRTDTEPRWQEESPAMMSVDDDRDRTGTDEPRLVLEADGSVQAGLEAGTLTCPGPDPAVFPYRYSRGTDRRIHVFDQDREVGRYAGIAAMRANAYRPVAMPLVPERHVRTGGQLARDVTLATVAPDGVAYEQP
ncbi:hypothetical protein [Natronorubrum sulfidifaciens]|nr:hypothetical protein [Natronorubrum sulfidifaciens]